MSFKLSDVQRLISAVLSHGGLPGEHPRDFTLLRLCDGDGRHTGEAAELFLFQSFWRKNVTLN